MTPKTHLILNCIIISFSFLALFGCGTKVGTGAVNVNFENNTASVLDAEMDGAGVLGLMGEMSLERALQGVTPTIYQMKLVAFYLVEDVGADQGNIGNVARIWTSSKCDADLTYCGINPANSGSYVVDYFDFAQGSDAVNAAFRSYTRDTKESQVSAGTYRYIRADFTGKVFSDSDQTPNLKFGTSSANEVRAQNGSFTMALPAPLSIASGETFTVDLAYDLENRFYASADAHPAPAEVSSDQAWTCNGTGSNKPCIVEIEFSPTVTKN